MQAAQFARIARPNETTMPRNAVHALAQLTPNERPRSSPRHAKPSGRATPGSVHRLDSNKAPRVVPIYWDDHFTGSPTDVAAFDEFLRTLFRSSWMTGLAEFGIAPAQLLPSYVLPSPRRTRLSHAELAQQLTEWLASGDITPKPRKSERSLFYLLLTPMGTELTLGAVSSPRHVSGYHDSARFEASAQDNLHYAVVPLVSTRDEILDAHSRAICHELAHAFIACVRK